jgi:hypothetical protein
VNLPVLGSRFWLLARSDCSRFFTAFIIFQSPATAVAQGAEVVVAQGADMAVVVGEAEKTRRRDDFGRRFGGNRRGDCYIDLHSKAALYGVK